MLGGPFALAPTIILARSSAGNVKVVLEDDMAAVSSGKAFVAVEWGMFEFGA